MQCGTMIVVVSMPIEIAIVLMMVVMFDFLIVRYSLSMGADCGPRIFALHSVRGKLLAHLTLVMDVARSKRGAGARGGRGTGSAGEGGEARK